MYKVLGQKFFNRPALAVARGLLGKQLARRAGSKTIRLIITEVEAYSGFSDRASHASRGKTARNAPMFGEAGRWYVYFTYGMHWMLNAVTGGKEFPAAILIRGVKGINGPGRLTKRLNIDRKFNGKSITPKTGLWIEDAGIKVKKNQIKRTPRIGVAYAGPVWSKKPWRFILVDVKKKTI